MPQAAPLHAPVTLSEYDGVRSLHLGTPWIQGSMRIAKPERIELDYVQRMLASLLWLPSARSRPETARSPHQSGASKPG